MGYQLYRGDDETLDLTFTDADGNAIDITDWTVWLTVKAKRDDADDDAKILTNDSTSSGGDGKISLTLSNAQTDIEPAMYIAEIQTKDTSGTITTWGQFDFEVLQDLTQASS